MRSLVVLLAAMLVSVEANWLKNLFKPKRRRNIFAGGGNVGIGGLKKRIDFATNIWNAIIGKGNDVKATIDASKLSGEFSVTKEVVHAGGYVCSGSQNVAVWRPEANGTFPLITFGHGVGSGGNRIKAYDPLLNEVASHGFVIMGAMSADVFPCNDFYKDMVRTIKWARNSTFNHTVDWSKPVGVTGHSWGGMSSNIIASKKNLTDRLNIGAAVMLHPGDLPATKPALIPAFFATGKKDFLLSSVGTQKKFYNRATTQPAIRAVIIRPGGHFRPQKWKDEIVAFFHCHLNQNGDVCMNLYSDDFCAQEKYSECAFKLNG